jgi:hypothetical protein
MYGRKMSNEIKTIPTCTHCTVPMAEGFIADVGHAGFVNVGTWIEGVPEKTAFGSAKTTFRDRYLLQAFRCPQCGRVEMFALEKRAMPL